MFTDREQRQIDAARRVIRRWSIAPSPCLREALVLGHLLRRRQPRLCIGVMRRGEAIAAHAWLEVQGSEIGKDEQFQAFVFSRS
ncbi:MAG: lasso peptide biosynthesis B2 protein [Egibacteraceae bacterium]